jgi:hypothetical protein
MISVYRLFQIIMGIILSVFILYVLVNYSGSYALLGRSAARLKTINVFLQDVDSVYFTGNPIGFTEFSRDDYTSCHPTAGEPPRIFCYIDGEGLESGQLLVPVFTRLGDSVLITRNSLDYGWTRQDYVAAFTGMTILFNVREDSPEILEAFRETVMGFPDTSGHSPKVTFGFCDGSNIIISPDPNDPWERDYIHGLNLDDLYTMSACTAQLTRSQLLVTLSSSCSPGFPGPGICISPPSGGAGQAYIAGSSRAYVYKDPADLAALITGGGGTDAFGIPLGEKTWEFKNQFMLNSLRTAAMFMEERCRIVKHMTETPDECRQKYQDLETIMVEIKDFSGDYGSTSDMSELKSGLDQAAFLWEELKNLGCERLA